jgi:hypothetical protein
MVFGLLKRGVLRVLAARQLIGKHRTSFQEIINSMSENPDNFHFRATSIGIYQGC